MFVVRPDPVISTIAILGSQLTLGADDKDKRDKEGGTEVFVV